MKASRLLGIKRLLISLLLILTAVITLLSASHFWEGRKDKDNNSHDTTSETESNSVEDTLKPTLVVALDDRPVNVDFPKYLAGDGEVIISEVTFLKDTTLEEKINDLKLELDEGHYDSIVISYDNLLYGGLVESRIVNKTLSSEEKTSLIGFLGFLKEKGIDIYSFVSAQRITTTVSSNGDLKSYNEALKQNALLTNSNFKSNIDDTFSMGETDESYYVHRANKLKDTQFLIEETSDYYKYFYIAQDDTQNSGIQKLELYNLHKFAEGKNVSFINGTDELVTTLIYKARSNENSNQHTYIYKTETENPNALLSFDGKTLDELLIEKQSVYDFEVVQSIDEADFIWIIHNTNNYDKAEIDKLFQTGKKVILTDLHFGNTGEKVIKYVIDEGLTGNLISYASWNTASNTIGLALSQAFLANANPRNDYLLEKRILKDYVYKTILKYELPIFFPEETSQEYNVDSEEVNKYIQNYMNVFLKNYLHSDRRVSEVYFPWHRLFELSFTLSDI